MLAVKNQNFTFFITTARWNAREFPFLKYLKICFLNFWKNWELILTIQHFVSALEVVSYSRILRQFNLHRKLSTYQVTTSSECHVALWRKDVKQSVLLLFSNFLLNLTSFSNGDGCD